MGATSEGGTPSDPVDDIVSESIARAPATVQGDGTSSSEEEEDSSICANQDKDGDQKMGRVLTPKQKKKRNQKGKGDFISHWHKKPRKDKSTAVSADTGVHPPHRRPLLLLHPNGSHSLHQFLLLNQDNHQVLTTMKMMKFCFQSMRQDTFAKTVQQQRDAGMLSTTTLLTSMTVLQVMNGMEKMELWPRFVKH